ncbi:transglutaminase-like cysteine peptidase [Cognatishimia sp. MH4019]|uniref:transglutaminase-like cysteine peptidase n=1 Tax=Cognatishimia sp. MH4019 TaxID=2854030 RepID=UPI001CD80067|nr:transglutaminase-like cysteine peptidase [Cognatishimia sp. MH4019]
MPTFFRAFCVALVAMIWSVPQIASAETFLTPRMMTASPEGSAGLCTRYGWACAIGQVQGQIGADGLRIATQINAQVNAEVREISDQSQYRQAEVWTLPTARGGDCEDFALLKKKRLIERGFPANQLLIATVLDRTHAPHAVLVVRTTGGDYVLDNLTDRVKPWRETGYTFLKMQSPDAPHLWQAVLAGGIAQS